LRIPGLTGLDPNGRFDAHVRDAILRVLYGAGSALAVLPFSDVMGTRERINLPGSISDANWTFRLPMNVTDLEADHESTARLLALARGSGRRPG
jgi:4-alpha-glucanotransferase